MGATEMFLKIKPYPAELNNLNVAFTFALLSQPGCEATSHLRIMF